MTTTKPPTAPTALEQALMNALLPPVPAPAAGAAVLARMQPTGIGSYVTEEQHLEQLLGGRHVDAVTAAAWLGVPTRPRPSKTALVRGYEQARARAWCAGRTVTIRDVCDAITPTTNGPTR